MNPNAPKITVIGGGTGSFTLLSSLKNYTQNISAIVNMVDDGGSTGVLRDEMGVLPAGDVRQCLVALSNSSSEMRELFNFRFGNGSMKGHSFGNLFISALEEMTDNFDQSIELAASVLDVRGRVIPVTLDKVRLVLEDGDKKLEGEKNITSYKIVNSKKINLYTKPRAKLNLKAASAIENSDIICIAPGNLYSSLIPTLLIDGVGESMKKSQAKIVYVSNLMTMHGQTDDFEVDDFVKELERFIGHEAITHVLFNNQAPSEELLNRYAKQNEHPIKVGGCKLNKHYIGDNLVSDKIVEQSKNDILIDRTLIRHNGERVSRRLMQLFFQD